MRQNIRQTLKENDGGLRSKFIKSANSIPYIMESIVDTNLINNIEVDNITFDERYTEIQGDIIITSWHEDPDLFEFTNQLKLIDKELDKVLLKYSFKENGSFGRNTGKYNNLMWYFVGCDWSSDNNYTLNMRYVFRQEEYEED
jgi:hypothetical protein